MASATSTSATNAATTHDIDDAPDGLLPQYGFGKTYAFDTLVERHRFLFRVHTPKRKHGGSAIGSRATSPQPSSTRATSPFATPLRRPSLTHSRSPSSSISISQASSVRSGSGREGSDYFGLFTSPHIQSQDLADEDDEDEGAPGDPYFLSRRFKDDLASPDIPTRRRTMSTLSTLSGSTTLSAHAYEHGHPGLDRSGRTRKDSVTRPGSRRSQSVDVGASIQASSHSAAHSVQPSEESTSEPGSMTYEDLVRHLDWTTRSSSPYVTTSFSFFWCLWEAVRRYKLSVKQDVEIAVIDARSVIGRARTALEILRGVDGGKQDKAYWKWFRFALESQDVLVFGAIPGDAIYASIPLTSILPRLPSYFFKPEPEVGLPAPNADPREPVANAAANEAEDPRSPSSRSPTGTQPVFFPPSTPVGKSSVLGSPGRPFTPRSDLSSYDFGSSEDGEERRQTAQLLSRLSWDIGTTLKPRRKSSVSGPSVSSQAPRHTSHADFCRALTRAFEGVETPGKNGEGRKDEDKLRDATTSAVKLAEVLIEPWFRARCAEAADPFRFDESDSESSESEGEEGLCLGLSGDGCSLEHRHEKAAPEDDTETEDPRMEAAETLTALSLDLARWPSNWWFAERRQGIESLVKDVVGMCVRECARGVGMRVWWGVQSEYEGQRRRAASEVGTPAGGSFFDERKGRRRADSLITGSPEPRGRDVRSRSAVSERRATLVRRPSDGSPSRSYPSPASLRESSYKPRARSPLGAVPALGPAFVLKSEKKGETARDDAATPANEDDWAPSTPPPTPPIAQSLTLPDSSPSSSMLDSNLTSSSSTDSESPSTPNKHRRSPPPPPPPRSAKRERETTLRKPASFASLDSSIESLRALDSPQGNETDVPGGWPEGENDTQLGSPFQRSESEGVPRTPQKVQRRPFSWSPGTGTFSLNNANAAGTGSSHQRSASDESSLSGSRKSSQESLRPYGSASGNLQPSPSPKPILKREGSTTSSPTGSLRRSSQDNDGEARDGEAFLAEVVSSALNLGMTPTAVFNLSSSPLKVDTTASARRDGYEKGHRRHSSIGEIDLSPVAELSGEKEAEEEEARARGVSVFSLGSAMQAVEDLTLTANGEPTDARPIEDKVTFAEPESLDEAPAYVDSTRYSRSRRSSTLASIPEAEREEEWEDWTMVDIPISMAASLKSTSSSSASIHEPETATAPVDGGIVVESPVDEMVLATEIPLPPSPVLAPLNLEEEPTEIVQEMNVEEQVDSSSHERRSSVPEITLSVPQEEPVAPIERATESLPELPAGTQPDTDELPAEPISTPPPETESTAALSLKRIGHAVLKTIGLSFLVANSCRSGASSPSTSTPSPVLTDADMSTALVRWSPVFSALRYWSPLFRFRPRPRPSAARPSHQHRRPSCSSPSASQLILGPRPAWNAPILDDDASLRSGGLDLDDAFEVYSQGARSSAGFAGTSWAMSCFVCGVMATLALASVQRQREMQMLVGNRYY